MEVDKVVSYILIVAVIITLLAVVYIIINPSPGDKFTEFYILGPDGKAGNYPTNLTLGESANLTIDVINHEYATTSYMLVVKMGNQTLKNESFQVENGDKKEIPFTFQANQLGGGQKLEFLLYKLPNNQQPYRYLYLVINVS